MITVPNFAHHWQHMTTGQWTGCAVLTIGILSTIICIACMLWPRDDPPGTNNNKPLDTEHSRCRPQNLPFSWPR